MDGRGGGGVCVRVCVSVCLYECICPVEGEEKHPGGKGSERERGEGGMRRGGETRKDMFFFNLASPQRVNTTAMYLQNGRYFPRAKKPRRIVLVALVVAQATHTIRRLCRYGYTTRALSFFRSSLSLLSLLSLTD